MYPSKDKQFLSFTPGDRVTLGHSIEKRHKEIAYAETVVEETNSRDRSLGRIGNNSVSPGKK